MHRAAYAAPSAIFIAGRYQHTSVSTSVDSNNSHRHWPHWMVAKYCDDSVFWSPVSKWLYFYSVSRFTEFDRKGESTRILWFCFPPGMPWEIEYRYDLAELGYGGSNRQDWCSNSVGRWHILSPVRTRLLSLLEGSRLYDSLLCRTDGTSGDFQDCLCFQPRPWYVCAIATYEFTSSKYLRSSWPWLLR